MKKHYTLALLFILYSNLVLAKKIEINDDVVSEIKSPKAASTGNDLRRVRRVGVGLSGAGPLGLGGVHLELNFNDRNGFLAGYGGGPSYQAVTFQYKRVLAGEWLLPYLSAGVSRWASFGQNEPIRESTPGVLAERFMSEDEKNKGTVAETLFYPAFGLQYVQLQGKWAGFSMFAELVMLLDVADFVAAPTGTVGFTYYF